MTNIQWPYDPRFFCGGRSHYIKYFFLQHTASFPLGLCVSFISERQMYVPDTVCTLLCVTSKIIQGINILCLGPWFMQKPTISMCH